MFRHIGFSCWLLGTAMFVVAKAREIIQISRANLPAASLVYDLPKPHFNVAEMISLCNFKLYSVELGPVMYFSMVI